MEVTSGSPPKEELHLFAIGAPSTKSSPIRCSVVAEGVPLDMKVDTGVEVSVILKYMYKLLFPHLVLALC